MKFTSKVYSLHNCRSLISRTSNFKENVFFSELKLIVLKLINIFICDIAIVYKLTKVSGI